MIEMLVKGLVAFSRFKRKVIYRLNPSRRPSAIYARELGQILGKQKVVAVDVGGAVDLQPHWHKLVGNSSLHIFEPHPKSYEELLVKFGRGPFKDFFHIHKEALSENGGSRTLYMTNAPTGSTILQFNKQNSYFHKDNPYFFPMTEIKVNTTTMERVFDEKGVSTIDVVKLDIQGAELEVLRGLGKKRLETLLGFEMEVNLQDLYVDGTTLGDLTQFVKENGFEFFDFHVARISVQRDGKNDFSEKYFDLHFWNPSVAAKAWEFDVVCFRKPDTLLQNKDGDSVKRLIACYCVYNFFFEAIELAEEAFKKQILTQKDFETARASIVKMKDGLAFELKDYRSITNGQNGANWGQYMWFKYPST